MDKFKEIVTNLKKWAAVRQGTPRQTGFCSPSAEQGTKSVKSDLTLFPAEPGLAEDPELVVVKMDLSSWRQEGVGQLSI